MTRALATGLAAVLTIVAVSGCNDGAAEGDRVVPAAGTVALEGNEIDVMLPSGQFTFTVTEPRDELAGDEVDDGDDGDVRAAPDGQSYVGVRWDWKGMSPALARALGDTLPKVGTVALETGDDVSPLFELDTQSPEGGANGTSWVLVPDEGDARLAITYDDHAQTVDLATGEVEAGVAAGYSDLASGRDLRCDDLKQGRTRLGLQYRIDCTVSDWSAVPYLAGRGWADDGETWLVVGLRLQPDEFRHESGSASAEYRVDRQAGTVRLGDAEAVMLSEGEQTLQVHDALYAVRAPAEGPWRLDLSRTYDLSRDGRAPGAPATARVRYHSTVTLGS